MWSMKPLPQSNLEMANTVESWAEYPADGAAATPLPNGMGDRKTERRLRSWLNKVTAYDRSHPNGFLFCTFHVPFKRFAETFYIILTYFYWIYHVETEAWRVLRDKIPRTKEENNGWIEEVHKHFVESSVGIREENAFSLYYSNQCLGVRMCTYSYYLMNPMIHKFIQFKQFNWSTDIQIILKRALMHIHKHSPAHLSILQFNVICFLN